MGVDHGEKRCLLSRELPRQTVVLPTLEENASRESGWDDNDLNEQSRCQCQLVPSPSIPQRQLTPFGNTCIQNFSPTVKAADVWKTFLLMRPLRCNGQGHFCGEGSGVLQDARSGAATLANPCGLRCHSSVMFVSAVKGQFEVESSNWLWKKDILCTSRNRVRRRVSRRPHDRRWTIRRSVLRNLRGTAIRHLLDGGCNRELFPLTMTKPLCLGLSVPLWTIPPR